MDKLDTATIACILSIDIYLSHYCEMIHGCILVHISAASIKSHKRCKVREVFKQGAGTSIASRGPFYSIDSPTFGIPWIRYIYVTVIINTSNISRIRRLDDWTTASIAESSLTAKPSNQPLGSTVCL